MSIIDGRRHDLINYPFKRTPERVRKNLLAQVQKTVPYFANDMSLAIIGFECFCQIYNQVLVPEKRHANANLRVIERFCALAADGGIFSRSDRGNMLMARYFLRVSQSLPYVAAADLLTAKKLKSNPVLKETRALPIDQYLLKYWSGWLSVGAGGSNRYFPLQDVYQFCGEDFTEKLFSVMDEFNRQRQRAMHGSWHMLLRAFAKIGREGRLQELECRIFSGEFFRKLLFQYLSDATLVPESTSYSTLAIEWRNHFAIFVEEYLCPSGLMAEPAGGFPMPRRERVRGALTNVKTQDDGTEIKAKLITDVPLLVTDREAIQLLFKSIEADLSVLRNWAKYVTDDVWQNIVRRKRKAHAGKIIPLEVRTDPVFLRSENSKTWMRSPDNPKYIENLVATFEAHGYLTNDDAWLQTIYEDRQEAARQLGMPSIKVLLAYCTLLILEHPCLTRSALLSLELYDKSGAFKGVNFTEAGCSLVSYKRRNGASQAEKVVLLNGSATQAVEQLVEVTLPLRNYLKQHGDDNWRYLFLSSGNSFAYPKRLRGDEIGYRIELRRDFREDLKILCVDDKTSDRLSHAFTLTRLRGSVGVSEYLKTTSVSCMARALGHKEYKKHLIDRYLPEPIRRFFEERWVRIFQAGIVCEAMKESAFLVEASDFSDMEEVDEFLRKHVISFPESGQVEEQYEEPNGEVLFGLNEEVLKLLCTIAESTDQASGPVNGLAQFWSNIASKLIGFIESDECERPDIRRMLSNVLPTIDASSAMHLLT